MSAAEGIGASSTMAAELAEGIEVLSLNQMVTFQKYNKFVLPADGFVFWFASGASITVQGSLHYSAQQLQEEDGTLGANQIIFTTTTEVENFNDISPTSMFIAALPDGTQYAFGQRGRYYPAANLYHYLGASILPPFKSQIISNPSAFDKTSIVVSDSLPFWLALNTYVPPYPGFKFPKDFLLYPSFAVPENILPPYGVVHIESSSIEGMQGAPYYDADLSPWYLTEEEVRLTTYGLRNAEVTTVKDTALQYSYDYSHFGIMNTPSIRDEKRTQVEISSLAMKKTISFHINYNQYTARSVARQIIEKATPVDYYPQPLSAVGMVPVAP